MDVPSASELPDAGKIVNAGARIFYGEANKMAAVGVSPDLIVRSSLLTFLDLGHDLVGEVALIEWLRMTADLIEAKLFTPYPPAIEK